MYPFGLDVNLKEDVESVLRTLKGTQKSNLEIYEKYGVLARYLVKENGVWKVASTAMIQDYLLEKEMKISPDDVYWDIHVESTIDTNGKRVFVQK